MAKMGDTDMHFNQDFFDAILKEPGIDGLCEEKAKQALQIASATAPVVTGEYRDSLYVEHVEFKTATHGRWCPTAITPWRSKPSIIRSPTR